MHKAKPWHRKQTGWWMVQLDRRQIKLLEGPNTTSNRKLAKQKLQDILEQRRHNPQPGSPQLTVAAVIEQYLTFGVSELAERTAYNRKLVLQDFSECHGFRIADDKHSLPVHIDAWLQEHPDWKSDWTKNTVVTNVQCAFNWAVNNRILAANPYRGKRHAVGDPRRPMTDDEFQSLLRATSVRPKIDKQKAVTCRKIYPYEIRKRHRPTAGARFRQVLIFLRFTGCRPGELCALRWSDIDFAQNVARLAKHKTVKKVRRPRLIALHPVVIRLLERIKTYNQPGEFVFLTHHRTPWNRSNLGLRMRRLREIAGLADDAKLYCLRHRYGTTAILNGVPIKTLAETMGHARVTQTEHYLHLAGEVGHLVAATIQANVRRPVV